MNRIKYTNNCKALSCKSLFVLFIFLTTAINISAQKRLVDEVKQDLNTLSLTVDNYKSAINKLAPALKSPETMNDAETWFIAGKAHYGIYDKYRSLKSIGQSADEKAMSEALISGYDNMIKSLSLDTIVLKNKDGSIKVDKKTGKPKTKTKYSKEIMNIIMSHYNDLKLAGRVFYAISQDYKKAYYTWDIYASLPDNMSLGKFRPAIADSIIGEYRFYQGVAAKLNNENKKAIEAFNKAISKGYIKKDVFDYAINCSEKEKDEKALVSLVNQAFSIYGITDSRYIGFLINYAIRNARYDDATRMVDKAIADNPNNAEYYDLKGVLVENQTNDIDSAFVFFKKSIELNPNYTRGNFDVGRYYYNKALRLKEGSSKKSSLKKVKTMFNEALPYLEKAYDADPKNIQAKDALKSIYYHLNDAEKLDALERKK